MDGYEGKPPWGRQHSYSRIVTPGRLLRWFRLHGENQPRHAFGRSND